MRIAVLGPLPPIRGGIAAHTAGVIDALRAHDHEVYVQPYGRLYPWRATGARVGSTTQSMVGEGEGEMDFFAPRTWRRAAAKILALAPDVVLAQYWTPISAAAIGSVLAGPATAKRIVVCHNVFPHERIPGARMAARRVLARCDGAIFHSRHVARQARALGWSAPYAIAAIPLLIGASGAASRPPPELRTDCAAGARMLVCPGHIRHYKGLGVLAAAWRRARRLDDDPLLVVAGEPLGARRELASIRRIGGAVRVIPRYLEDAELSWLLTHADAVLLPYVSASQSGLLPSALRLARHVIASDAGGLTESLLPAAGGSVRVVAAGDVDALAAAIRDACSHRSGELRGGPNHALRHATAMVAPEERRASWEPLLSALVRLARPAGLLAHSNSATAGASVRYENLRGEAPVAPWYDAPRL